MTTGRTSSSDSRLSLPRCREELAQESHPAGMPLPSESPTGIRSRLRRSQVFAVSSAGAVFKLLGTVPPLSLAAWRLQLTTLLLLPGCVINFRSLSPGTQLSLCPSLVPEVESSSSGRVHRMHVRI